MSSSPWVPVNQFVELHVFTFWGNAMSGTIPRILVRSSLLPVVFPGFMFDFIFCIYLLILVSNLTAISNELNAFDNNTTGITSGMGTACMLPIFLGGSCYLI